MGTGDPMNPNEMLDYALGQLEGPAKDGYERRLASDPPLAQTQARLTRSVHRLLDDGDPYAPPPDLASRTLAFVAASSQPRRTVLDFWPTRVPFRAADVAVAAGIMIAGLLTLLPVVYRSKATMAQVGCADNLQRLGLALWLYGGQHKHFPYGPERQPDATTGTFVALLNDERLLTDLSLLDCPSNGPCGRHGKLPRFEELCQLRVTDPQKFRDTLCWDYAYNIGFRRPSGRVEPIDTVVSAAIPLLSDQPDHENHRLIRAGNSPNHGGLGQNVLFTDLHVGWYGTRRVSPDDDDLFLNADHLLAPGLRPSDAVLCPALVPFNGWDAR